jgi:hypothetical protein
MRSASFYHHYKKYQAAFAVVVTGSGAAKVVPPLKLIYVFRKGPVRLRKCMALLLCVELQNHR